MKRVLLLNDTVVRFEKGSCLEVSDEEAARLIAFRNAEEVAEPHVAEKKPATKKATAKK